MTEWRMEGAVERARVVRLVVVALVVAGLSWTLPASPALADTITYTLTTGNVGGLDCCTGPYADVTVNRTSTTTATVTFDSLTNGGYLYLMAGTQAADLNVNATTFSVDSISGTGLAGFTPGGFTNGGSGNVDGFGIYNVTIDDFDGFTHSATQIVVTLTNISGTWATASDVLTGTIAAIHGFACATPCTIESSAFATGYADNATVVPEPGTMLLAATYGGLALGWAGRRWRRNRGMATS